MERTSTRAVNRTSSVVKIYTRDKYCPYFRRLYRNRAFTEALPQSTADAELLKFCKHFFTPA